MIYLLVFVINSVLFNQCLRFAQKYGANVLAVVVVNYFVAAAFSLALFFRHGISPARLLDWPVVATACLNGVFYFVHILFVLATFRMLGVGITNAIIRSGIIIPAFASWLVWHEPMTITRWVALGLVPVSMFLMRRPQPEHPHLTLRADLLSLACFVMAGVILTIHKFAEVQFQPDQREVYKTILFLVAALSSLTYALARRVSVSKRDVAVGVALGACNATNLLLVLLCLALIPAVVFFPTTASLEISLNVVVSRILWKEELRKRQLIGLALAVGIVLLANTPIRPH